MVSERTWVNWGRTASCRPTAIHRPRGEEQIQELVRRATQAGRRIKAVGSGHSFTAIACTEGELLDLRDHCRVLEVDERNCRVRVESGITIAALADALAEHGLALENQGDVAYQTVSGAVSTGTHGTGERLRNLSSQVCGLTLILPNGELLSCSAEENPEVFQAARVGLGALGVIGTLTIQCVPAFQLRSLKEPRRLDEVLERFDDLCAGNDHFEFFWFPHTEVVQAISNNRTDEPAGPRSRLREWWDGVLMENHAFGAVQRLGQIREDWLPGLMKLSARLLERTERVGPSHRIFANQRLVRFAEMEYAIPRRHAVSAVRELRVLFARSRLRIGFPIEVRTSAGDDIPLSPAQGRESAYIAVHVYWRRPWETYFREVETIMDAMQGRPHWGKLHFQRAATLRQRYPEWDRFAAVRDRLDPDRRFANEYLERVLGP
jgi:FAD-linked oxidoreductase